jgi:hypothetical protein
VKHFAIYRESDNRLIEGGFFDFDRASDYCHNEYNSDAERDGETERYYVAPQASA